MPTTDEVFGIQRSLPLNYINRASVDALFVEELTRKKNIVVYGGSKQGKTSLRNSVLKKDDFILVQCINNWKPKDIYHSMLKESGFKIEVSSSKTTSGDYKITASVEGGFWGIAKGKTGVEKGGEGSETIETAPLDLDLNDPSDIIGALKLIDFKKYIIVEDFHYLPYETQRDFAHHLKIFIEKSNLSFVIVGVWKDKNRLSVYNGDLAGRLVPIDADAWSAIELDSVIQKGCELLNVSMSETLRGDIIGRSATNVYLVQECCHTLIKRQGVNGTIQGPVRRIPDCTDVVSIMKTIVDQSNARYTSFMFKVCTGFKSSELEMYKWILRSTLLLSLDKVRYGITYREMKDFLSQNHPRGQDLNQGNLTQALKSLASLQSNKDIRPIILDYDETERVLNVVDRGFLIWLAHQNRTELSAEL